ncbi:MAG: hypothetical protein OXC91_10535 [Rhodobacteraceae bacterium]|nr:hypothetical protein [Paracoccaceae bacterium]
MYPQDQFCSSSQEIIDRAHALRAHAFRLLIRNARSKLGKAAKSLISLAGRPHLGKRSV